jgi:hypothetical protein
MTVIELQARMANPALTPKQRADARRAYGQLIAAKAYDDAVDFACEAYGTRVWDVGGGQS